MSSKDVGDRSEAIILAKLLELGYKVLTPFGDNSRYDLVVDLNNKFIRIQCKTASLYDGIVSFNVTSNTTKNGKSLKKRYTPDEIDHFMIYCTDLGKIFLMSVKEAKGTLRVEPPKNGMVRGIKWAKDYEFTGFGDVTQW